MTLFSTEHREPLDQKVLSPLRYPGGKLWLASYVDQVLSQNSLHPKLFVEPFAGGASIALTLLANDRVDSIGLMDRDPLVAAFWKTVFHDTEWLVKQIQNVKVTLEHWQELRANIPKGRRRRAMACLFFNRTNYSGILARSAGPIGGQRQTSSYKIDCRFPRETLITRIQEIARLKDRVAFVWGCSWQSGIEQLARMQRQRLLAAEDDTFFYFDPPFFEKADQLYSYYFSDRDHQRLRTTLPTLYKRWVLSYDAADKVEALYGRDQDQTGLQLLYVNVEYTAARSGKQRTVRKEAIIAPKGIMLPNGSPIPPTCAKTAKFISAESQMILPLQIRTASDNSTSMIQEVATESGTYLPENEAFSSYI